MKRWAALAGVLLITVAAVWWVVQVASLPPGARGEASGFGQFVLAALGILIIAVGSLRKAFTRSPAIPLDERADLLAAVMHDQWHKAARERRLLEPAPLPIRWRRSELPVAVPVEAATSAGAGQERFDPLPGLTYITSEQLREGDRRDLHAVYGGLASGRLVITGPGGSGKSAAAILLLLDALRHRKQDPASIPVPVIFTLHGWNPATTSVRQWLITKLTEIPVLRRGGAAELLDAGRVAVFLDGLDEINTALRPVALRALSDQATFRLVLLTRSAELMDAARHGPLAGAAAIELQPVTPRDAREYLLRPLVSPAPAAWQAVADNLNTGSLGKALNNPLTLTLLRDAYEPTGPVNELLDTRRFRTPEDIENHLLDHALVAAYTPRLGQPRPRYSLDTAQRTLGFLAHRLNREFSRDLAWWKIPRWTSRGPHGAVKVGTGVLAGFLWFLGFWITDQFWFGLLMGVVVGAMVGYWQQTPPGHGNPRWIRKAWWRGLFTPGEVGMALSVAGGLGFAAWLVRGNVGEVVSWMIILPLSLLVRQVAITLSTPTTRDTNSHDPREAWRKDVATGGALCCGFLTLGSVIALTDWIFLNRTFPISLAEGLLLGLSMTLVMALGNAAWPTFISQIQLAKRHDMPRRLLRFLEDARSRQVLRTVGPVYQFRHGKLQDRLAAKAAGGRVRWSGLD